MKLKNFFLYVLDWLAIARDEKPLLATVVTAGFFLLAFLVIIAVSELAGLIWGPLVQYIGAAVTLAMDVFMYFFFRRYPM